MQIKEFTEFICTLAEKSGDVIKPYFAKANLAVEIKEDETPVTQADREAEAVMRDLIRKAYPQHGILGEEFGPENTSAEFVWTLDPIDGTISFARGCPLFGTLIGLLHTDRPILRAIHNPILNQLCIGNNTEPLVNAQAVQLRQPPHAPHATLRNPVIPLIPKFQTRQPCENCQKP